MPYASVESTSARAATRARISELDNETETLQRSIEALSSERDRFQEELAAFKYPVLSLPAEIVSAIFTHFLPAYPERSPLVGSVTPSATRARISKLDNEIETLQRSIEALRSERDRFQEELATYKYPVLSLPAEIVSAIFTHFLPAYPKRSPLVGSVTPSFLCRICRRWRNVALSTPTLWSAIRLRLKIPRRCDPHRYEEAQLYLLQLWLQRSRACRLSLEIVHNQEPSISSAAFVEAILQHAHRWEVVHLILPQHELHQITGPMPLLRTAVLGLNHGPIYRGVPPPISCAQAPNLKDVVLSGDFSRFSLALPWSQIAKLTATLFQHEVAAILRDAVALEDCWFSLICKPVVSTTISPIPPLVRLRSLSLLTLPYTSFPYNASVNMRPLFDALTLPALESVVIFEPFLGLDPVATLSRLRPNGHPQRIRILGARTSDAGLYAAAFPQANITVEAKS
ncbi:hypothetical protein B0H11DRAFT_2183638 [Mycena galericulata]|nr:hypothetical protein B0H11DRAFT_2183638 [Mycena galericulata]